MIQNRHQTNLSKDDHLQLSNRLSTKNEHEQRLLDGKLKFTKLEYDSFVERTVNDILTETGSFHNPVLFDMNELVQRYSSNSPSIEEFHQNLDCYLRKHFFELQPLFHSFHTSKSSSECLNHLEDLISILYRDRNEILPKALKIQRCRSKFQKHFQKNPSISKRFLGFAEHFYTIREYLNCIENCNFSIVFGHPKSKNQSRAYYLRSRCLFYLSKHDKALSDLEKSIEEGILKHCPSLLAEITELYSYFLLNVNFYDELPIKRYQAGRSKMDSQYVSPKVEICKDQALGRKVLLNSAARAGEILFIEKPEVCHLLPQYEYLACDYCLTPLERFVNDNFDHDIHQSFYSCPDCIVVVYCSKVCSEKAYQQYHRLECSIYGMLSMFGVGHLALRRMLIKSASPCHGYEPRKFLSNIEFQNYEDIFQFAGTCLFLHNLLRSTCKKEIVDDPKQNIRELVENILFFISNAQSIESFSLFFNQDDINQTLIGTGLYDILPMLNHSCVPNISISFENGSWIVVRAKDHLPSRTELRNSYGVQATFQLYEERHQGLLEQYHFNCDCSACDYQTFFDPVTIELKSAHTILTNAFMYGIPDTILINIYMHNLDVINGRYGKQNLQFRLQVLLEFWKRRNQIKHFSRQWIERFILAILDIVDFYDYSTTFRINEYHVIRRLIIEILQTLQYKLL